MFLEDLEDVTKATSVLDSPHKSAALHPYHDEDFELDSTLFDIRPSVSQPFGSNTAFRNAPAATVASNDWMPSSMPSNHVNDERRRTRSKSPKERPSDGIPPDPPTENSFARSVREEKEALDEYDRRVSELFEWLDGDNVVVTTGGS